MVVHSNQYFTVEVKDSFSVDHKGKVYQAINRATGVAEYETPIMINCVLASEELADAVHKFHSGELLADAGEEGVIVRRGLIN